MTFDEWVRMGFELGFCSPPVCGIHDGIPSSALEDEEFEGGLDPCMHIVRLYEDTPHRKAVEANDTGVHYRAVELGWKINQPH